MKIISIISYKRNHPSSFIETNVFDSFHLLSFARIEMAVNRIEMAVNRGIGIGIEWL